MNQQENRVAPLQALPKDYQGIFYLTNPFDFDFIGRWDKKEYLFPAMKTTPLIGIDAKPYEIQNIRKKFAYEMCEQSFFKSDEYKRLDKMNDPDKLRTFHAAISYNPASLESLVQKCLEPMPVAPAPTPMPVKDETPKVKVMKRLKSRQSGDDVDDSLENIAPIP